MQRGFLVIPREKTLFSNWNQLYIWTFGHIYYIFLIYTTDGRTMTEQFISITIRPPYDEFSSCKIPIDILIEYMGSDSYIVSLEKGKSQKEGHNHYQIGLKTGKNINTIRKAINRFFKPHLLPSTLKKGVWRKVKSHNNKVSLFGYCLKEGHLYSTNIEESKIKAELELYNSQIKTAPKKKAINWPKCRRCKEKLLINVPNYCCNIPEKDYTFYNYFCKKCNKVCFPIF